MLLTMVVASLVSVGVACGGSDRGATSANGIPATSSTGATRLQGKVTVFAASSLTESFKAIGEAFTNANPGVTVEFNFASSSALATQIEQAAPADVFASADQPQMQRLVDDRLVDGTAEVFARNLPVVVVPAANRAGLTTPKDLAKSGIKLVLAAQDVPIGNYARQIIDRLAADPAYGAAFKDAALRNLVSNEANVRAVLTKIELGEGDAGIVYTTDALVSKEKVRTIAIPEGVNVIASYPIAVLRTSKNAVAAAAFVAFVRGPEGQSLLKAGGFNAAP
ncbi:MAG: molybdate ABC transporter substrate-binding protein [Dehalococcoidia bacterium]